MKTRCPWSEANDSMREYHDTEWGVQLHDDRKLFEFLILDIFQAGLSWTIILNKRENFDEAFDGFDPNKIARYDETKVNELLSNAGIIRNRSKILATVNNAKAFLEIQQEFGSFDRYIWQFVGYKQKKNAWTVEKELPASTQESENMSRDLKRRGFAFTGPTVCYAFMQSTGMVNDHIVDCFRYDEVS
ncbi:MAG: DNA-3-methyladenine glycosylase I [Candidatus Bipolaricaulia bacterium]